MKKYLHLLLVALFSTLTFSLTSCSDDDDEPSIGKSSLTINGEGFKEHSTTGATSTYTDYGSYAGASIKAELYPSKSDELEYFPCVNISLDAESGTLTKGMTIALEGGYVEYVTDVMQGTRYDEIKSGKITVSEVKGSSVTLKFDNLKLINDDNEALTINGTLTCEYTII